MGDFQLTAYSSSFDLCLDLFGSSHLEYHEMRLKFRVSARSETFFPSYFDPPRVNGHEPLPSLNPRAERVSYSPVFHRLSLEQN